jgi:hypothetical protein
MSSSEQANNKSSQSSTNRVRDLKARLLSKQQKPEIRDPDSVSSSPKSIAANITTSKDNMRTNSSSNNTNPHHSATSSTPSTDDIVNASIQSKLDLGEDRVLCSLVKSVMLYLYDGSIGSDTVQKAFEAYSAKELITWNCLEEQIIAALDSLGSARDLLDSSNEDLKRQFPDFQKFVTYASLTKRHRLEYNEKASEILQVNSKEEAGERYREISEVLDALRQSNHRLAKTIEYRNQQLEPLVYWTRVLQTGRF